jgi:hypothetical protein
MKELRPAFHRLFRTRFSRALLLCALLWGGCSAWEKLVEPGQTFRRIFEKPVPASVQLLECRNHFALTESTVYLRFRIDPAELASLLRGSKFKETNNSEPWNSVTSRQPYRDSDFAADRGFWSGGEGLEGYVLYYDTPRKTAVCWLITFG